MVENWVKIEYAFRELGIYFELRSWVYFCLIEGRGFYYSPNTGKWRMKGKRAWQTSQSPEDFMAQAKAYSPPDDQAQQQKTQQKTNTKRKNKKRQKQTKQETYSSRSKEQQPPYEEVEGIRSEFLAIFAQLLQKQRKCGYKIGWIWYKIQEDFLPSPLEICWLSVVFKYSPQWAVYKVQELYGAVNRATILFLVKTYQQEWFDYFQRRWGIESEHQHKQQRQQKRKKQTSHQHQSTRQTFVHQTYLQLLGLTFPFTRQELKRAYRKRALETHPDSGGTAEAFRNVNTAYQTLALSLQ